MSDEKGLVPVNPETAIAPATNPDVEFGFGTPAMLWTSIDDTTPEGKALILRAASDKGNVDPDNLIANPFPVQHVLAQKVHLVASDTGELVQANRVALIAANGDIVSFVSQGIINSLGLIFRLYGKPPFDPVLKIRLRRIKTRRGFTTYNLDVVV
jgi:hypothetical protein